MNYINTQTLAQITESDIRALNPNTSFSLPFQAPAEYAVVFDAPATYDPVTQTVSPAAPELTVKGHWEQRWAVTEKSPETIAAEAEAKRPGIHTAIKAERDRRKFNGVYVSNKWIHTDTYSRTQWMGMVMMGASVPAIEWTTMDNTTITTSQTLASQVFSATAALDAALFAYAKSLIALVDASNDPTSVNITTGWPATFEGV